MAQNLPSLASECFLWPAVAKIVKKVLPDAVRTMHLFLENGDSLKFFVDVTSQ